MHIEEEELKRLVSEGEIRAFRDQEKMKFKKEDIERFKKEHGKDVIEALDAAGKGSRDLPTVSAGSELPEELVFDEDDSAGQPVGMETAPIADDSFLVEEEKPEPAVDRGAARGRRVVSARAVASRARAPAVADGAHEPGWVVAVGILTALILLIATMATFDAMKQRSSALTSWAANIFSGK
ncbi:MAG: hypothetical protein U1E76_20705 [Planctomycetota bacterium]